MAAVNVLKFGSFLLRRNYTENGVGKWKMKMKGGGPPWLSVSSTSPPILHSSKCREVSSRVERNLLFCNVAEKSEAGPSSSPPESTSSPSSSSAAASAAVVGDDTVVMKNAANTLDIRVGHIVRAWRHEEADSLYVEEVDIGEPEPRIICSGLVKYIPLEHLQNKNVIVLANLKPRNMRGIKSFGMLMAASDASHENVELLVPPEGSLPGERVWFGSADEKENLPDVASPNQIQKKKTWELVQPHLKTDISCLATLGEHFMRTSAGVVVCSSLKNANIS